MVLQCVAVCCRVLQGVAVCKGCMDRQICGILERAPRERVLVYCRVLQGVAGCFRVLQGVAGCCSMLQSVKAL